jgi:hypothetical protein
MWSAQMGLRAGIAVCLLPLALAACGSGDALNVDALDDQIAGNGADPALMGALQDQIMVDPQLAQQSNKDAIRPPSQPYSAAVPAETVAATKTNMPAEGELLKAPAPVEGTAQCAANLNYSASWAAKLPADIPLHPQARIVEAAGTQGGACALRAVSFSTPQPLQTMIDWYYTRAVKGGFTAEHQRKDGQHVLGGTRARDDSAFVVFLSARADGGTDLDLIASGS